VCSGDTHLQLESITKAIRLVEGGARFIATNPDETGPSRRVFMPATGACRLIESGHRQTGLLRGQAEPVDDASALRPLGGIPNRR